MIHCYEGKMTTAAMFERETGFFTAAFCDSLMWGATVWANWLFADLEVCGTKIFIRALVANNTKWPIQPHMVPGLILAISKMKPGFEVEVRIRPSERQRRMVKRPIHRRQPVCLAVRPGMRELDESILAYTDFMRGGPKPANEMPFWRKS